jgi:hypothetical protein
MQQATHDGGIRNPLPSHRIMAEECFFHQCQRDHPILDMLALTKLDMLLQNHFPLTKHISQNVLANGQIIVVCILVIILKSAKHIINPLAKFTIRKLENISLTSLNSASIENLRSTKHKQQNNNKKAHIQSRNM